MPLFTKLPSPDVLDRVYASLRVRLSQPGDEAALHNILASPDTPFVVKRPESPEEVRSWIDDMTAWAETPMEDRSILFSILHDNTVIGSLTARLSHLSTNGLHDGEVPSVEYTMYIALASRFRHFGRRAVVMIEPAIVDTFGIKQVVAEIDATNEAALASVAGFDHVADLANGFRFYRRDPIVANPQGQ